MKRICLFFKKWKWLTKSFKYINSFFNRFINMIYIKTILIRYNILSLSFLFVLCLLFIKFINGGNLWITLSGFVIGGLLFNYLDNRIVYSKNFIIRSFQLFLINLFVIIISIICVVSISEFFVHTVECSGSDKSYDINNLKIVDYYFYSKLIVIIISVITIAFNSIIIYLLWLIKTKNGNIYIPKYPNILNTFIKELFIVNNNKKLSYPELINK